MTIEQYKFEYEILTREYKKSLKSLEARAIESSEIQEGDLLRIFRLFLLVNKVEISVDHVEGFEPKCSFNYECVVVPSDVQEEINTFFQEQQNLGGEIFNKIKLTSSDANFFKHKKQVLSGVNRSTQYEKTI